METCSVPYSCCKEHLRDNLFCGYQKQLETIVQASEEIFIDGCVNSLYNKIRKNALIIAISVLFSLLFQIFAAFSALYLNIQIKAVIRFCRN